MSKILIVFIMFAVILSQSKPSHAESTRRSDGNQAAMAKAQMMMRQLHDENTALKNANVSLKTQLQDIEKKISTLKKSKSNLNKKLKTSKKINSKYKENSQTLQQRIRKDRERMRELIAKFKELLILFRNMEQEKTQLAVNLSENQTQLLQCAEYNLKLVDTNEELLERYVNKGVWASISQAEPFTQLKQVEIEKIAQEYQSTIDFLKMTVNEN